MYAVRNIVLCTKDCLCLYVCPTGATDTETGQIDAEKCIDGCRACVDACPSHAISLMPEEYPPQQNKADAVKKTLFALSESKTRQEKIAAKISKRADSPALQKFSRALSKSNRLMAEDILREAGYMLPQSQNVRDLIKSLMETAKAEDFPKAAAERLLTILKRETKEKV